MKQFFSLTLLLLTFLIPQAQTILIEVDNVIIPANKKLGIGVNNPLTSLDVNGGIRLGDATITSAGVMRYHLGEFQGYNGSIWKSLSSEVDGSITNELITNFALNGNSLQINENGNFISVDLSAHNGPMERNGTVVRQKGNYTTDDFIIGKDELPQPGQNYSDNLLFFDKSKGAFRLGRIQASENWVDDSIGYRSIALGFNTLAKGANSMAIGQSSKANSGDAFATGSSTRANGSASMSGGSHSEANGDYSLAYGQRLIAPSYAEVALGVYNSEYNTQSTNQWNSDDRLFVIGNGNSVLRSDALCLWKNGQMGLGVANPDARLHIESGLGEDALKVYVNSQRQLYIAADGQVAIGDISSLDAKLYVESDGGEDLFRVRSEGTTKFKINENGGIRNSNATATYALQLQNSSTDLLGRGQAYSWNTFSDQRIKSNIQNLPYGLKEIMSMSPKVYNHHDSEYFEDGSMLIKGKQVTKDIGLLAQEVYEIIPEAVSKPDSEDELWSMDYTRLVPVLIKSIQEQQEQINSLDDKLLKQQDLISQLHTLIIEMKEE